MRTKDVISKIELICNLALTEDALVHFGDLMFPFRVRESISARRKHFSAYVTPPTTVGQFNHISVLVCKEKTDKCMKRQSSTTTFIEIRRSPQLFCRTTEQCLVHGCRERLECDCESSIYF